MPTNTPEYTWKRSWMHTACSKLIAQTETINNTHYLIGQRTSLQRTFDEGTFPFYNWHVSWSKNHELVNARTVSDCNPIANGIFVVLSVVLASSGAFLLFENRTNDRMYSLLSQTHLIFKWLMYSIVRCMNDKHRIAFHNIEPKWRFAYAFPMVITNHRVLGWSLPCTLHSKFSSTM